MTRTVGRLALVPALIVAWGVVVTTARADSLVPTGTPAPALALPTLAGETIRLADLKGRVVLLLFGELYNSNSVAACRDLVEITAQPATAGLELSAYLIVTQKAPAAELLARAKDKQVTLPILRDERRSAFEDYHVTVLPSLVVLDGQGVTVLACAGYPLDFRDMVTDAVLYAAGKVSDQDSARRRASAAALPVTEAQARAMRLAALGAQLAKRGSEELALSNFKQALALDPECVPARTQLAICLLNRGELAEAERHFLKVLGIEPESVEAGLGLIQVQIIRGGSELESADQRVRQLLREHPNAPRVLYLAGLVAEKSGDIGAALGHYKKAAELLLVGRQ